jgi:hypothetical protein
VFKEGACVLVLVFAAFQEFAFHDARVSSGRLVNQETVVVAEKLDHELAVGVLRQGVAELGSETEDNLIVHPFKKVFFGRFGHQAVYIAEGVLLVAEAIVGRNDDICLKEVLDFSNITGSLLSRTGNSMLWFCL